jgi:2-polyprenyl-3-methyl-5-hydroxy-6-metoxy-1,4-benzoquinol methylase
VSEAVKKALVGEGGSPVDVANLLTEIRQSIREKAANGELVVPEFRPTQVRPTGEILQPVQLSEELSYLNQHWNDWYQEPEFTSHRKIFGSLLVKFKRKVVKFFWQAILEPYMNHERAFQMNLVRFLNSTARYIDQRDSEIFWELIHKIDADTKNLQTSLHRVSSNVDGTIRTVEKELGTQIADVSRHSQQTEATLQGIFAQVQTLESVARGIERVLGSTTRKPTLSESAPTTPSTDTIDPSTLPDLRYLLLENRYRGSEEAIYARQASYAEYLKDLPGDVVDLGCGRGELLDVLKNGNIPARGIDLDDAMIERCQEKKLPVQKADLFQFLKNAPAESIGGITALQVVEHLTPKALQEFIELSYRSLKPGGRIILETINPLSITALARNFFRDPTHEQPIHPDTLGFLLEMSGFAVQVRLDRSPYPEAAKLQPFELTPYLPAHWTHTVEVMNDNIIRLNELLFAPQDFALVAEKPVVKIS